MDGKAEREALLRYLGMSAQNQVGDPNDGNNYGYSSSMPLAKNPARHGAAGAAKAGAGALMMGASAAFPWWAMPVVGAYGLSNFAEGGIQAGDALLQMNGTHPNQKEMDEYVNAMRYYGHKPMGPR